jgi:uncharacterized protein (DUF433 family)
MLQDTTGVTTTGGAKFVILSKRNETAALSGNFLPDPRTIAVSSAVTQHERIASDPNILSGDPYVRGTRIPIAVILDGLAEGLTPQDLMKDFPRLTLADIRATLEYMAAEALSPGE